LLVKSSLLGDAKHLRIELDGVGHCDKLSLFIESLRSGRTPEYEHDILSENNTKNRFLANQVKLEKSHSIQIGILTGTSDATVSWHHWWDLVGCGIPSDFLRLLSRGWGFRYADNGKRSKEKLFKGDSGFNAKYHESWDYYAKRVINNSTGKVRSQYVREWKGSGSIWSNQADPVRISGLANALKRQGWLVRKEDRGRRMVLVPLAWEQYCFDDFVKKRKLTLELVTNDASREVDNVEDITAEGWRKNRQDEPLAKFRMISLRREIAHTEDEYRKGKLENELKVLEKQRRIPTRKEWNKGQFAKVYFLPKCHKMLTNSPVSGRGVEAMGKTKKLKSLEGWLRKNVPWDFVDSVKAILNTTFSQSKSQTWFLGGDIEKMFPSIPAEECIVLLKDKVSYVLGEKVQKWWKSCRCSFEGNHYSYGNGFPIGSSWSPQLARFYLGVKEMEVVPAFLGQGGTFSRYADDLVISGEKDMVAKFQGTYTGAVSPLKVEWETISRNVEFMDAKMSSIPQTNRWGSGYGYYGIALDYNPRERVSNVTFGALPAQQQRSAWSSKAFRVSTLALALRFYRKDSSTRVVVSSSKNIAKELQKVLKYEEKGGRKSSLVQELERVSSVMNAVPRLERWVDIIRRLETNISQEKESSKEEDTEPPPTIVEIHVPAWIETKLGRKVWSLVRSALVKKYHHMDRCDVNGKGIVFRTISRKILGLHSVCRKV